MASTAPKVLFDVCGLPAIAHVARAAEANGLDPIIVVVAKSGEPSMRKTLEPHVPGVMIRIQDPPLGTGHAVRCALPAAYQDLHGGAAGDFVVLYGDGPLYSAGTLGALLDHHRRCGAAATLLTAVVADPRGYGRVVIDGGRVRRIVEEAEADDGTRSIVEINTGIVAFRAADGARAVAAIPNDNAKGEYYLTDAPGWLAEQGLPVERVACRDPLECASFNSIEELATVRARMRRRILQEHMGRGVDVVDPDTTYVDVDVEIGPGTRILPCSVVGRGVRIGRDCVIGPFANLHGQTVLEDGAHVGNFVEVKKSTMGRKSKAKHLTYLGDATIGAEANIGCGTITANYDGKAKHETRIGSRAFIGSGTVLIAPAEVGAGAVTGAGAVVRRNTKIGPGEVYVGVPARRLESRESRGETPADAGRREDASGQDGLKGASS